VEIVGNGGQGTRTRFDGQDFSVVKDDKGKSVSFARTEAIGREVAKAAVHAPDEAQWSSVSGIEVKEAPLDVPMDNEGYLGLMQKGVLTALPMPKKANSPRWAPGFMRLLSATLSYSLCRESCFLKCCTESRDIAARIVLRQIREDRRSRGVWKHMRGKYRFMLGLTPDEMGYIVPGYDFFSLPLPMSNMAV
jgi:hypothetical protein